MDNEIATFGGRNGEAASVENTEAEDLNRVFLIRLGDRVREARARKNISRKVLAEISGVSIRYLAQLETGSGNISIILLRRVAEALDYKIEWLVGEDDPYSSDTWAALSLFSQADQQTRARVLTILDPLEPIAKRENRIAFIGLRGAGKSTIGRLTAQKLDIPFLELNEEIEQASGMPVDEVIALYGQEGYRRLEKQSLERVAATHSTLALAVAGGIVSEPETFNYLLRHYHTIWLKADPTDHMSRVRDQGDERPMAGNPEAMSELRKILKSREALYARAEIEIDTSAQNVEQTSIQLLGAIKDKGYLSD